MVNDKQTTSNNWSTWAKFVLSELERLAILEDKQNTQIDTLNTRVTQLEGDLRHYTRALTWIAGVAAISLSGLILWVIQNTLLQ